MLASAQRPPATGIKDFESSGFCRKYRCVLTARIEPLKTFGVVSDYFYSYRAYLPDKTMLSGQFGMRLDPDGDRSNPYLIVRWIPVTVLTAADLRGVNELLVEITGVTDFDVAKFVLDFARARSADPKPGPGPMVKLSNYDVYCTYTPSKPVQVTLLLEQRDDDVRHRPV